MIAPDDSYELDREGYEPDLEELAYGLYREREFESLRLEYGDIDRELRDQHKHTDRQLRDLNKERQSLARELWQGHQFDVAHDAYEMDLDGKTSITVSRDGSCGDSISRPRHLTRKEKRRRKTECRRALRQLEQLGFLMKRGCSPRQVEGYEDTSLTTVVAAT